MKVSGYKVTLPALRRILGGRGHITSSFNRCVGGKLFGSHPKDKADARKNFTKAAKECKGK